MDEKQISMINENLIELLEEMKHIGYDIIELQKETNKHLKKIEHNIP